MVLLRSRYYYYYNTNSNPQHGEPSSRNNNVWLLVAPPSSSSPSKEAPQDLAAAGEAAAGVRENRLPSSCDVVKVVYTHTAENSNDHPRHNDDNNVCIAVVRGAGLESYHVHKLVRTPLRTTKRKPGVDQDDSQRAAATRPWQQVSRYERTDALLQQPPKPVLVQEALRQLHRYLSVQETVLDELRPLAAQVVARAAAAAAAEDDAHPRQQLPPNTLVVLVCNAGHAALLLNFVCAARAVRANLSRVLLFAMDEATAQLARALQLACYYHPALFAATGGGTDHNHNNNSTPEDDVPEYGTLPYAHVMLGKVYCVHLISSLGYDFIFHDVDMVPYRKDYLEHFVSAAHEDSASFDLYFQNDHSTQAQYQPWSINSGFYYARNNRKTRYFFSALLRQGDLILRSRSHQAVMAVLLSEHASLFGLQVQTMSEVRSREFPVGYHFHKDRAYMKDMILGNIEKPYVFHMNWNDHKETKRKFNQQLGDWFVDDSCIASTLVESVASSNSNCCVREPIIVCHFRDKPSKIPCESSPLIEDVTSFW